jgi:hypothetical protein
LHIHQGLKRHQRHSVAGEDSSKMACCAGGKPSAAARVAVVHGPRLRSAAAASQLSRFVYILKKMGNHTHQIVFLSLKLMV